MNSINLFFKRISDRTYRKPKKAVQKYTIEAVIQKIVSPGTGANNQIAESIIKIFFNSNLLTEKHIKQAVIPKIKVFIKLKIGFPNQTETNCWILPIITPPLQLKYNHFSELNN